MPYADSPPLHVHRREDEVFHILEGRMRFHIDGRERIAGAGETVIAPKELGAHLPCRIERRGTVPDDHPRVGFRNAAAPDGAPGRSAGIAAAVGADTGNHRGPDAMLHRERHRYHRRAVGLTNAVTAPAT
ncbi:cupin domain-containing protein [Sinorhizobium fredii]|uniref:cupin domain-containing protein n=1 Tax=Rhizobium fredii TaxID=380 RepID=UPI001F369D03|nr:cupin domain-containing protein [Sinorhizobium fredii]